MPPCTRREERRTYFYLKCPARRGLVANVGALVSDLGSLILELDHFEDVYEEMCVSDCPAAPVGAAGTD